MFMWRQWNSVNILNLCMFDESVFEWIHATDLIVKQMRQTFINFRLLLLLRLLNISLLKLHTYLNARYVVPGVPGSSSRARQCDLINITYLLICIEY